jgi:hypothetical protein
MATRIENWLKRHQHPASRALHGIAIPLLPVAGVLVVVQLVNGAWALWWRPVALLAISYLLQWIGHRLEGNDLGEAVLVKKLLGRPYVDISPKYTKAASEQGRESAGFGEA